VKVVAPAQDPVQSLLCGKVRIGVISRHYSAATETAGSPQSAVMRRRFLPAPPTGLGSYVAAWQRPPAIGHLNSDHLPPRAVGMLRSSRPAAMARSDSQPAAWSSLMVGMRSVPDHAHALADGPACPHVAWPSIDPPVTAKLHTTRLCTRQSCCEPISCGVLHRTPWP
jgi:hypothetical protein